MPTKPVLYHEGEFPPEKIDWERLIPLIGPANAALARFDGVLAAVPNATVLLSPLMTQEAVLSSSRDGDWTGWCVFFLTAIMEQARENYGKAMAIVDLYKKEKDRIFELIRSQYAMLVLDFMFNRPIFTAPAFISEAAVPKTTAQRILKLLQENVLLREIRPAEGRKPAVLAFDALINIAEGHRVL